MSGIDDEYLVVVADDSHRNCLDANQWCTTLSPSNLANLDNSVDFDFDYYYCNGIVREWGQPMATRALAAAAIVQ